MNRFTINYELLSQVLKARRILGEPVLLERLKQQVKNTLTTTKKVTA